MKMKILPENWKFAVFRIICVIIVLVFIRVIFIQWFRAFGTSMEPTISDGSIVFVNKITYKVHPVKRGDIIVFRTSNKPYVYFIKRVLGLPGEKIEFREGLLFINGVEMPEPYLKERGDWNTQPFIVRKNHFFVCGDNRLVAWENHFHPQISMKNIVGRVIGYQ